MADAAKRYLIEFGSSMFVYCIVLPLSVLYVEHHMQEPARYAVALLPVIPLLAGFIAIMRFLGSMDELQRRIQLDAFAVAAGATALCTFAYAMLQGAGAPQIGFEWILPFIVVVWGFTAAIARLRYTR